MNATLARRSSLSPLQVWLRDSRICDRDDFDPVGLVALRKDLH